MHYKVSFTPYLHCAKLSLMRYKLKPQSRTMVYGANEGTFGPVDATSSFVFFPSKPSRKALQVRNLPIKGRALKSRQLVRGSFGISWASASLGFCAVGGELTLGYPPNKTMMCFRIAS